MDALLATTMRLFNPYSAAFTRIRTNSCRTRALLSFGCRSKIKMIYYRLPKG